MGREEIAQGCFDQAEWAVRLGSPMYDALLRRMAEDVRAGGLLAAVPPAVLPACIQTNDIGRSRGLLPGFLESARRTGLPLRLLEIGASAGLNLRWDHFSFLEVPADLRVVERRGCNLNPIDPTLDESRTALLSFIWPDQTERFSNSPRRSKLPAACRRPWTGARPPIGSGCRLPSRGPVWIRRTCI